MNDRLSFELSWNPFDVTKGVKIELECKGQIWLLVMEMLTSPLAILFEDLVNGVYLSVDHRQGWGVDGFVLGNYTDPRVGVGFNWW